jgi:hypothetical protein
MKASEVIMIGRKRSWAALIQKGEFIDKEHRV